MPPHNESDPRLFSSRRFSVDWMFTTLGLDVDNAPVRRALREQLGDVGEADAVFGFEPWLSDPVLLGMVEAAQADAPAVGRL